MPHSSSNNLILPLVLWNNTPPQFDVSSLIVNETEKYILTGTTSGHIVIWDFNLDEIIPIHLMIGHTSVVNCLAKAGHSRDEEYIVSSSENGEMKLWEINNKKCIEYTKTPNYVHKKIYSSKVNGKYTRLFCIGNYSDVLVMDPINLDILYTLVSRERPQWIRALCINTLANKQDDVIVGVSVSGTIKLWTVNANEQKGSEVVEHEFKNCACENACVLASCPGKQRIFIVVCPTFFQIFDAFDFTVLCEVHTNNFSVDKENPIIFTNGFFLDIEYVIVCTNDGYAYLYHLPENVNPQSSAFRQKSTNASEKYPSAKFVCKFATNELTNLNNKNSSLYCPPIFYLYDVKKKLINQDKSYGSSTTSSQKSLPHPSVKYLIRGGSNADISAWNLDLTQLSNTSLKKSDIEISMKKFWKDNVKHDEEKIGDISTLLYLPTIDKIVYGLNDGSIVIVPAIDFLIKHLFRRSFIEYKSNAMVLKRHNAKVTCILYPHSEHTRYDPNMLVTGSLDFSVILWNINTGEMVHRFVVQTGEILQLSVPPNNVNPRILQCVCSIASDHSIALLSLKECKPVMIASRHLFPIMFIKWRPLDDYLLVKCSDGGVFVWQIETGNLDRVAHGLLAEDILNAADELAGNNNQYAYIEGASSTSSTIYISPPPQPNTLASSILHQHHHHHHHSNHGQNNPGSASTTPMIVSNKLISNQTIELAHILQKRSYHFSSKVFGPKSSFNREDNKKFQNVTDSASLSFPLLIQPFHMSAKDPFNHLLLFDVDSLLTTLVLEEQSIDSLIKYLKNIIYKETHNVQTAPVQLIAPLHRTTPDYSQTALKRVASAKLIDALDIKQMNLLKTKINYAQSIIKLTHILLSALHVWSVDESLDKLFTDHLNLQQPKYPTSFGNISNSYHLFVTFPAKKSAFNFDSSLSVNQSVKVPNSKSISLIKFESDDNLKGTAATAVADGNDCIESPSPSKEYWLSTKSITTEYLLAILAISNSFMNLQCFIDLQLKKENVDPMEFILGDHSSSFPNESNSYGQSQIKQAYSRLSTMYCMLSDYLTEVPCIALKTLNLETLALKWMDQSYEIRESAQALLKNELKRIGPIGRSNLIKLWEPQLSNLLKDFDDLSQLSIQQPQTSSGPGQTQQQSVQPGQIQSSTSNVSQTAPDLALNNPNMLHGSSMSDISMLKSPVGGIRRKQYVAIILLSLIGAEFGQDVNSNKSQMPHKTIPQGFSLEDHSILKRISTALSNLVTNKSLNQDITRRAAIDLIARGFAVWEPFIQPTFIILCLLELSADAELYVPRLSANLPLSPIADTCKIARNSLSLIANSKPKTFILTIAKEIKRVNATSNQSSQNANNNFPFATALTRGKPEILVIIEKLIDSQSQDVFELLSDVIEIVLFCLESNQIRSNGLEESFPPLFKFPMVRYCKETKRIICGCHNGRLVMYEYKTSKWNFQSYPAHNSQPIVSVAISHDSKYVASYSAHDNSLIFWQSSGGNIFNIGSNSLKPTKTCTAAPIELTVPSTRLASLSWQNRTLNLCYHDNRKFSYQI